MNVAELILASGEERAPAVFAGKTVLTFGELRRAANAWACRVVAEGATHGDRVGLLAENSPLFVAAYLGTIRAGLCTVPFPVDSSQRELERMAVSTGMKRMIVSARLRPRAESIAQRLGLTLLSDKDTQSAVASQSAFPPVDSVRDLAAIMLTSGTTGQSKGVMVTHRNIEANTRDILRYLTIGPADRVMVVLPLSYCYGASLLHTHLMAGASMVLNNRFLFPEKVLDEMVEKQCTGLAGVPSTYQILLRKTRFAQRSFPALRWLQQAGGRLPNALIREVRAAAPQARLLVMYGQTEATARLSYLAPERLDEKLGSIGRGLSGTRLEVLRPDGFPVRPGSDEVGEIVAFGDNITLGYWGDPEETARFFRDGKLYTGDLARVDQDGFLYLVERTRDFVKSMGYRVSPKEIEDVIAQLPDVVEAAVIGVPHETWGEALHAFVVGTAPARVTADQVRTHCLRQLPNYKVPEFVEFLPCLPKNSNGKVDKEELRREFRRGDL